MKAIFDSDTFEEKSLVQPLWMKDNQRLSFLDKAHESERKTVWILETDTGLREQFIDPDSLNLPGAPGMGDSLPIHAYAWSPDETKLLLPELAPTRFSPSGNLFLYDAAERSVERLTDTREPQRNAKFSPDGKLLGFVRSDNLWTLDLETRTERQWTFDASAARYNGRLGWVYEEELGLSDGWAWSPDGLRIAYFQQDETCVPELLLPDYDNLHMTPIRTRYPRAGDPNPTARIGVLDLNTGETRWMRIEPEKDDEAYAGGEFYVARMQWTPCGNNLLVQRLNRLQNHLDVILADPDTGDARVLFSEQEDAWLDSPGDARFVGEDAFLLLSERDGWRHAYLYSVQGHLIRQVTWGEWEVDQVLAVDSDARAAFFSAARPSPVERHVYRVSLDGGEPKCLTASTQGWNRALFSHDASRFVHTHSTLNQPPVVKVKDAGGAEGATIIQEPLPNLAKFDPGPWELLTIQTSEGETLNARMLMPKGFDPERRYPVLMHAYGGPGSQIVTNQWGGVRALWYHLLAQQGYGVFMVDNRGTGGRGASFEKQVYRKLGEREVNDQMEGARFLHTLPWVDPKRIGIWGWSYGGCLASLCMMRGADLFRAGVAVAPVTDWTLYDSIYTERYMRLPSDNPDGYLGGSPITHADKLKGRFLLIHGLQDDNVHFQNSARLANALQDAKRSFETMFYPARRHGLDNRHFHLFMTMTEFLRRSLLRNL